MRLTFEESSADAERIDDAPLTEASLQGLDVGHAVFAVIQPLAVLGEHICELLGPEATFVVVSAGVAAMLRAVNMGKMDAEEGVREPGRLSKVGQSSVDHGDSKQGHEYGPVEKPESDERLVWGDNPVLIKVKENAVLLEDLHFTVDALVTNRGLSNIVPFYRNALGCKHVRSCPPEHAP